ncbi:hypothetical protein N2W54_004922 [Lotmaria passim]
MPVELKKKRLSSKSAKRKSSADDVQETSTTKKTRDTNADSDDALPEAIRYLGNKYRTSHQRAKFHQQFEELTTVIGASNPSLRALAAAEASATGSAASAGPSSSTAFFANAFPTLLVGYLARAMGLNASDEQIASIIELVEEDGPSTGFVDKRKLEPVLMEAVVTGTIGGPTLREFAVAAPASAEEAASGKLSFERLEHFTPSLCARDDEATLFRAFEALDVQRKGYLEEDDLRVPMTTEGDRFSAEEANEMWMAMRDPESNRLYYRDFADVLARE